MGKVFKAAVCLFLLAVLTAVGALVSRFIGFYPGTTVGLSITSGILIVAVPTIVMEEWWEQKGDGLVMLVCCGLTIIASFWSLTMGLYHVSMAGNSTALTICTTIAMISGLIAVILRFKEKRRKPVRKC